MRTLTLMRHAKSSWTSPQAAGAPPTDKSRPLAPRGERDAPRMAAWMAANDIRPGLALCSTAIRTRQTLDLVKATALANGARIEYRDDLYLAGTRHLLEVIHAISDEIAHVLFVGHDPGMHDTATLLAGRGDPQARRLLFEKFPTAGVAVIDFDAPRWRDIGPGVGTLRHFMSPKRLPD